MLQPTTGLLLQLTLNVNASTTELEKQESSNNFHSKQVYFEATASYVELFAEDTGVLCYQKGQ